MADPRIEVDVDGAQAIYLLLRELYQTDEEMHAWLHAPQPLLAGDIPADLLETAEGRERCVNVLSAVCDGAYI